MSTMIERRLARCERRSRHSKGNDRSFFYLLQGDDPDPDLSGIEHTVFVMDLRGKQLASPKDDASPAACGQRSP